MWKASFLTLIILTLPFTVFASSSTSVAFITAAAVPPKKNKKQNATHHHHHQVTVSLNLFSTKNNHQSTFLPDEMSSLSSRTTSSFSSAATVLIFALTIATATLSSYPSPVIAGDITKGSQIFTPTCAGCHAGGNNFIKEKKTLKKDALEKFVGLDETKMTDFFKNSFVHKGPAGGGTMSDEVIADVMSYVLSQAVNDKW